MRVIPGLLSLLLVACPAVASGQSFLVEGSAGPTLIDPGHSLAVGAGFSPTSRLTFSLDLERTHVASQFHTDGRGTSSAFRGGTLTLAAAQMRVSLFGRHRVTPYGLAGYAAGVSRPNVNDVFRNRVTNQVRAIFFGGGLQVPITRNASVFADARLIAGAEGVEGIVAVAPLRAGLAWRF